MAADALLEPDPPFLAEDLAADLERMAAARRVEEVGRGSGVLVALAIGLPLAVRAVDLERP
jgi:hypothetical protein